MTPSIGDGIQTEPLPNASYATAPAASVYNPLRRISKAQNPGFRSSGRKKERRMKKHLLTLLVVLCCVAAAQNAAQSTPKHATSKPASKSSVRKNAFTPDEIQYGPAPAFVPPGATLAVLEGNPMGATGDYTVRLKMPDGYKIAPHWHPKRENVTVISGTLKVGMGDKFDESKMMSFAATSFAYLDPSMHHYAMSSGETVVQIHGMAPLKFNYVNPGDDPSKKK
jgi:hypothetical protein